MAEYINRDALLAEAKRISGPMTGDGWDNWGVYALINRQPAADVEERKYGKWEYEPNICEYQCSICGRTTTDRHDEPMDDEFGKGIALCLQRYCGFCGAYMRDRKSDREEKHHEDENVTLPQAD